VVHQERVVKRWLLGDVHAVDDVSVRTLLIFFSEYSVGAFLIIKRKKALVSEQKLRA
jgi:hypothetical protein